MLVGPSGCGKTTSLKMVNRLIEPTGGQILVGGEDVMAKDPITLRRGIGYVIQQVGLLPHLTIGQNVAIVPRLLGWDKARQRERTDELLTLVGLEPDDYRERFPAQLSGGERQRVGVARALAADPPLMLMDEPFGAVDPIVRERLQNELLRLQEQLAKTIVFVTHDIDEAIKMGDLVAVLQVGGVLAQFGPPAEILANPAIRFRGPFRRRRPRSEAPVADARVRAGADRTGHRPRRRRRGRGAPPHPGRSLPVPPARSTSVSGRSAGLSSMNLPASGTLKRDMAEADVAAARATHDAQGRAVDAAWLRCRDRASWPMSDGRVLGLLTLEQIATALREGGAAG